MKRAVVILAVCAIALAANAVWVDLETRPAAARDGGAIFDTAVVPANVRIEGSGPPILFLHGFGAAIDWWDDVAPALAADHRVIRLDLIGHGGTEAPRSGYTIVRQAELASAILDKLGVERVTVVAHSMGGEVATALADTEAGADRADDPDRQSADGRDELHDADRRRISRRAWASCCRTFAATPRSAAGWRRASRRTFRCRRSSSRT